MEELNRPPETSAMRSSLSLFSRCACASVLAAALVTPLTAQSLSETPPPVRHAGVTAVQAGVLIDGTDGATRTDVTILIRDGRIEAVGSDVDVPADAERVDLSEWTVLPGFIDLHTHLTGDPEDLGTDRGAFLFQYPERPVLTGVRNAHTTLMAGFTTIRDLGAPGTTALALRDAIADGIGPGPRMITAIGHRDQRKPLRRTTGIRPGHFDLTDARARVYNGPRRPRPSCAPPFATAPT
jgi:imidazolonepropionase-like amidohydrolase